jgi:hypothetical protein
MRAQRYKDRVHNSIRIYEQLAGRPAPDEAKDAVIKYMERKIDAYVKNDTLITGLISIATVALLKIRMGGKK